MTFSPKPQGHHHAQPGHVFHPGDKVPMSAGTQRVSSDEYQNVMMEKQVFEILNKKKFPVCFAVGFS